jgi:hypothetical protein
MSTSQKGEVSLEFLILTGLILVIFASTVAVIGMRNQDIANTIKFSDAQTIADRVASEINMASRISGYYSEFTLPYKISDYENYSLSINKNLRFVQVTWGVNSRMSNIVTENVTGTPIPGKNTIRNSEGVITIES